MRPGILTGALVRALALTNSSEPSLIEELFEYFRSTYFTVETGRYQYIAVSSGTLVTLDKIVLGIFAGCLVAAFLSCYDKGYLGGFVRALVDNECLSPEKAKTLYELGYAKRPGVASSLRGRGVLAHTVRCVERDEHEQKRAEARQAYIDGPGQGSDKGFSYPAYKINVKTDRFYIPDEDHVRAEIKFEKKGSDWRSFLLVLVVGTISCALVCYLLPDMLQLVDNLIGILSGEGNVLN